MLVPLNMFMPPVTFTDSSKAVLLLWIFFVINVSCLSLLCYLVCSLQTWGPLLGKADLLVLLCVVLSSVFVSFPYGFRGKVRYLID